MALGRRCNSMKIMRNGASMNGEGEVEELKLEFVRYTRSFGRKRILISKNEDSLALDSSPRTPLKRFCSGGFSFEEQLPYKSPLERLPQDILIRILCGVEHGDLEQLFCVSKAIRDAALIAKQWHFAYSTPTKKTRAFRTPIDFGNPCEFDDIEAPNAPKQPRSYKSRLNGKSIADLSVALFASPKRGLDLQTEM